MNTILKQTEDKRKGMTFSQLITMKKISYVLLFLIVLAGCDTPYDVFYEIENRTDKVVFIDAHYRDYHSTPTEKERTFTVAAGETVRIYSDGGVNANDYIPDDRYASPDEKVPHNFDKCDIYIDDVLISDSLRCRKNWDYVAKKRLGVYTLRITEERR
jgi:hypothetical protein